MLPIYGTLIKVIAGFYLGCTGYLVERHDSYIDKFDVKLSCQYENQGKSVQDEISTVLNIQDFEIVKTPRQ